LTLFTLELLQHMYVRVMYYEIHTHQAAAVPYFQPSINWC